MKEKSVRFTMVAILLIFLSCDCAIPRKLNKKHFPEGEINGETHNWNKRLEILFLRDFIAHQNMLIYAY